MFFPANLYRGGDDNDPSVAIYSDNNNKIIMDYTPSLIEKSLIVRDSI